MLIALRARRILSEAGQPKYKVARYYTCTHTQTVDSLIKLYLVSHISEYLKVTKVTRHCIPACMLQKLWFLHFCSLWKDSNSCTRLGIKLRHLKVSRWHERLRQLYSDVGSENYEILSVNNKATDHYEADVCKCRLSSWTSNLLCPCRISGNKKATQYRARRH